MLTVPLLYMRQNLYLDKCLLVELSSIPDYLQRNSLLLLMVKYSQHLSVTTLTQPAQNLITVTYVVVHLVNILIPLSLKINTLHCRISYHIRITTFYSLLNTIFSPYLSFIPSAPRNKCSCTLLSPQTHISPISENAFQLLISICKELRFRPILSVSLPDLEFSQLTFACR